ncbi:Crp/Fnr family transcriptional regulator [Dehalobacter sp.]|uniref:Crp/Fnr family transcriptional regulator n=1 Tax=Dehalobacter sp. TaxID=1962289 RepID=UPI00258C49B2|nr:Crp/Fnr family transcriptional regulator [Dehalobacter sp.]MDJ0306420.1 Crp/Fnr family transcriptional regulator [Dehalobacter sp.]
MIENGWLERVPIAMEEVKICSFSKEQFEKLVITNPRIAIKIINYLSDKLNDSFQQAGDSIGTSIRDKLLRLIVRLADDHGTKTPSEKIIELNITQQDIADMIGASRVMVEQTLKELQKIGIIGKRGRYHTLRTDSCMNDNFS